MNRVLVWSWFHHMPRGNSTPILSPASWGVLIQHVLSLRVGEQTRLPRESCCCCNIRPLLCCPWAVPTSVPPCSHFLSPVRADSQLMDHMSLPSGRQLVPFCLPAPGLVAPLLLPPSPYLPRLSPLSLCLFLCPVHVCARAHTHTHTHTHTLAYCHHPFSNSLPSTVEFTLPRGQDHERLSLWITCCRDSKKSKERLGRGCGPLAGAEKSVHRAGAHGHLDPAPASPLLMKLSALLSTYQFTSWPRLHTWSPAAKGSVQQVLWARSAAAQWCDWEGLERGRQGLA